MVYYLKILAAPEKAHLGVRVPLKAGDNLVGRVNPPCQIVLEGTKVSKKHCSISVSASELSIKDLNSSNGVFLNGKKVMESKIAIKDRMVIGEFTLELVAE